MYKQYIYIIYIYIYFFFDCLARFNSFKIPLERRRKNKKYNVPFDANLFLTVSLKLRQQFWIAEAFLQLTSSFTPSKVQFLCAKLPPHNNLSVHLSVRLSVPTYVATRTISSLSDCEAHVFLSNLFRGLKGIIHTDGPTKYAIFRFTNAKVEGCKS